MFNTTAFVCSRWFNISLAFYCKAKERLCSHAYWQSVFVSKCSFSVNLCWASIYRMTKQHKFSGCNLMLSRAYNIIMWGVSQGSGPESINIFCTLSYKRILPSMVSGQCTYSFISNGMFELTNVSKFKKLWAFYKHQIGLLQDCYFIPSGSHYLGTKSIKPISTFERKLWSQQARLLWLIENTGKPSHECDCQIYKKIILCQSTLFWGVCHSNFHHKNSQVADSNDRGQ